MSFANQRWACPRCRANNMIEVAACFQCKTARPAMQPAPRYQPPAPAPVPPQYRPTSVGNRKLPVWGWVLIGCLALPFVSCMGLGMVGTLAGGSAHSSSGFRIHRSDILGTDSATGRQLIRCQLCAGSGKTWHWGRDGSGMPAPDAAIPCASCSSSGAIFQDTLTGVRVVPDSEPSDYSESLAAR
jgi:hypothetical protein